MGRHIRKMTLAEASQTAGREMPNAVRCGSCRFFKDGYCAIFAKRTVAAHPACKYGRVTINSDRTARRKKEK